MVAEIAPKIYTYFWTRFPSLWRTIGNMPRVISLFLLMPFAINGFAALKQQEHLIFISCYDFYWACYGSNTWLEHHICSAAVCQAFVLFWHGNVYSLVLPPVTPKLLFVRVVWRWIFIIGIETYWRFQIYEMMDMGIILKTYDCFYACPQASLLQPIC